MVLFSFSCNTLSHKVRSKTVRSYWDTLYIRTEVAFYYAVLNAVMKLPVAKYAKNLLTS
jgi:hypothetical protein